MSALALAALPELRVGLFVGNNAGDTAELPLMFAVSDARKMHDLFVDYGGVDKGDAILLENQTRRAVERSIETLTRKIAEGAAQGRPTTLVFFYSGHGDDHSLHLGPSQITHAELRTWLEASGADVRLAFLDACQSGSAVRAKGGQRGPAFDFAVEVEHTRGTAFLTSSAASELSQESSQVGGGFFTHYLHSALLGAADADRDGDVSLPEAYTYVHGETVFGTRDAPGAQTPGYDFNLVGSGDVTLTTLERANSHLSFLGDLDGTFAVWDESRKRYVAEVNGERPLQLAVRPGTYYVHRRMPGWIDEARYPVRRGETLSVLQEDFVSVAYEDAASRGELDRQVRRALMPDLSLRAVIGARAFGGTYGSQYLPQHAVGGIEARFLRTGTTWFSFDLLTGGGGASLDLPELGALPVRVSSTSLGASLGASTRPRLIRAGFGAKGELVGFRRSFPNDYAEPQGSISVAFGPVAWVGLHRGWFSLELQFNLLITPQKWDDDSRWPAYVEIIPLSVGVRF